MRIGILEKKNHSHIGPSNRNPIQSVCTDILIGIQCINYLFTYLRIN